MTKSFECSNIKLMYTLRRKKRCFVETVVRKMTQEMCFVKIADSNWIRKRILQRT